MQKQACLMVVPVFVIFFVTAFVSTFAVHDHHHRKLLVGSVGLVASVAMSGAPLVAAVSYLLGQQELLNQHS